MKFRDTFLFVYQENFSLTRKVSHFACADLIYFEIYYNKPKTKRQMFFSCAEKGI